MAAKGNNNRIILQYSVYYKKNLPTSLVSFVEKDPRSLIHKDGVKPYGGLMLKRCTFVMKSIDTLVDRKRIEVFQELIEKSLKCHEIVDYSKR